jgi:hypothetical protein
MARPDRGKDEGRRFLGEDLLEEERPQAEPLVAGTHSL